jgi:plastocyanin
MIYTTLAFVAGLALANAAPAPIEEAAKPVVDSYPGVPEEHGRELFPLLPGTKRAQAVLLRHAAANTKGPQMAAGSESVQGPIKALEMLSLNDDLNTVVSSDNMCTRRHAMARAAGLAAGLSLAQVSSPGFAAETKTVKMGADSGTLVFVPDEVKICAGDSVTWTNNKGGPHNVVFDEDAVPSGVSVDKISMDDQLGDEGATYTVKLDAKGSYGYFCEPHRGAGMTATVIVE